MTEDIGRATGAADAYRARPGAARHAPYPVCHLHRPSRHPYEVYNTILKMRGA